MVSKFEKEEQESALAERKKKLFEIRAMHQPIDKKGLDDH